MRGSLWSLLPKHLPVISYLHGRMGPCGSCPTRASCRIGASVLKKNGKKPDGAPFNRVLGMAQATRCVLPDDDLFSTPADPSKTYSMFPLYHRCCDYAQNIWQEKLRAIFVWPKWRNREWWKPYMEITLQGYNLYGPETKACLHQYDDPTPLPQRGRSTMAL